LSRIPLLTNIQLDAIREIGNIGAGNAATALSKLLGRVVEMDVPKVEMISIYELSEYYGSPTTPVASVFMHSEGKFSCSVVFIDSEIGAKEMIKMWLNVYCGGFTTEDLPDEMLDSGLAELGNVIIGSLLGAINALIGTEFQMSVPGVAHDMLGSILDVVASIFGTMGEYALVVSTTLRISGADSVNTDGNIIFLPNPEALELLLGKLQVL
jgi:chemotaxis protein CheC